MRKNLLFSRLSFAWHFLSTQHWRQSNPFINRGAVLSILLLLSMSLQVLAQQAATVTGIVRDERGQTLPGVSVTLKGTTTGTVTDLQGRYSIKADRNATLVFSFIGYTSTEQPVSGRANVDVTLKETQQNLNEVVVIGYGTAKRRELTGSVASVSGKDIANVPVPNIAQAMQGKLPGVNITTPDGRPGSNVNIRVRGGTSISQSNQALILIDGIPGNLNDIPADQVESVDVLKDASSAAIYGSRGANGVVLVTTKSAKAGKTAISYNGYSRINTPLKYLEPLGPYDYLKFVWANAAANAAAYQTPFEQLFGLGANSGSNTGGIESYRNLAIEDIQRQAYKQSTSWNHALTVSGGTEKTKVLFSATYSDDQGMKLNSYQKRAAAQLKINQKLYDNLQLDLNIRYANTPTLGDEGTSSGGGSILSSSYQFRPISTANILGNRGVFTTANNITQYGKNVLLDNYSPIARISDAHPLSLSQNFVGIASLNWLIIKGLTYHTDFSGNGTWTQRKYWWGAAARGYLDELTGEKKRAGDADYRKNDSWGMRWANTLNYQFNVGKDHKFNVLGGHEFFDSGGTGISIQSNGFASNFDKETAFAQIQQYDKTVATAFSFSSSVATPDRLNSYFGRLQYTFKDRYILSGTFRADASSKFTAQNRWGYFPGGGFTWIASDEAFLKDVRWLNALKFRAAYGAVGNNNIPSGSTVQSWGSVSDPRNQYYINHLGLAAYQLSTPSVLANPNLKWETTITRDIGTDFSLFDDRLSGTIDVYWNTTKDLLLQPTIPPVTGFTTTFDNVGQVSNRGIELSLFGRIISNKNWKVTAGGNINFNRNKIDALASNVSGLYGSAWNGTATYPAFDYQLVIGRPVGLVRGLTYEGFYTPADFNYNNGMYTLKTGVPDLTTVSGGVLHGITTGDRPTGQVAYPGLPKYKDLNGDLKIDDKDLSVIANTTPNFTGGFTLNVAYKNIDMGMNFNYSVGNDIFNANKLLSLYGPKEAGVFQNKLAFMANSYKMYNVVNGQLVRLRTPDEFNAANANATYPLAISETGVTSTIAIEKGSFLRLNTLTLGYTIPKSVLAKAHISSLRIYGSVYNLLTITNYSGLDPEVGTNDNANNSLYPTFGLDYGAYPRARSFVVGLNLNF